VTNTDNIYIEAFNGYKARGLNPLPIYHVNGNPSKKPLIEDWPIKAASGAFTEVDFTKRQCNIGVLLGGEEENAVQNLTDLDLDCPEAVNIGNAVLDLRKEKTVMFGRKSKPRSHYLYSTDKSLPSEKINDPLNDSICLLEYRCVKKNGERGFQTVFPPSIRYDDKTGECEEVCFEEDSVDDFLFVDSSELHSEFRNIAVATILARYFPSEGGRHETILALAGVFVRNDIQEDVALVIIAGLAYRYSAGYNQDEDKAMADVQSVYRKFAADQDAHLYGYPKLIELIDKKVVDRVLELLNISQPKEATSTAASHHIDADEIAWMMTTQHLSKLPKPVVSYLIEPEIIQGVVTMVSGKPGCGKTTIIMKWCKTIAEEKHIPVFYLNKDNPQVIMDDRMTKLGGLPDNFLMWGRWIKDRQGNPCEPLNLESPALAQFIKGLGNCVVVVDTLRQFAAGRDENSNNAMTEFFDPIKRWTATGATCIVIHHSDKEGKHPSCGAGAIEASVDAGLLVEATHVDGKIERMIVKGYRTRMGDNINIVYKMVAGIPIRQTETIPDKLLSLLSRNPGKTKDAFILLAMETGFVRATVRDFIIGGLLNKTLTYNHKVLTVATQIETPEVKFDPFADEPVAAQEIR
jgi:archaellum biogenesis ATPase FlaH